MESAMPVLAAGAVVWRAADGGHAGARSGGHAGSSAEVEVLLVHRPRYDDWSFPKGKLDPGEHALVAAVREIGEETGVAVRLGPPLPLQHYPLRSGGTKRVHYWAARPMRGAPLEEHVPNAEVDDAAWVALAEARRRLTYPRDVEILDSFAVSAYRAEPLVVLRHTDALPRESWTGPDRERALSEEGVRQARALVPLLGAYGVRRVLSSDAVRCTSTVQPYADASGLRVEVDHRLSEESTTRPGRIADRVGALLREDQPLVVCSHRPVLPALFDALGVQAPHLRPGGLVVVHRQAARVLAAEHHEP